MSLTPVDDVALIAKLVAHEVGKSVAKVLVRAKSEICRIQLEYLPFAKIRENPGGWLANAIRDEYGPPIGYVSKHQTVDKSRILIQDAFVTSQDKRHAPKKAWGGEELCPH